jgi:hypothetical protein
MRTLQVRALLCSGSASGMKRESKSFLAYCGGGASWCFESMGLIGGLKGA